MAAYANAYRHARTCSMLRHASSMSSESSAARSFRGRAPCCSSAPRSRPMPYPAPPDPMPPPVLDGAHVRVARPGGEPVAAA